MSSQEKITRYAKSLCEENRDKYEELNADIDEMYKKIEELSIDDFKNYFDEFIKNMMLSRWFFAVVGVFTNNKRELRPTISLSLRWCDNFPGFAEVKLSLD